MAITAKPKRKSLPAVDVDALINKGGSVATVEAPESEITPEPSAEAPVKSKEKAKGKPGRPPAKRSDPDFVQTSPYIKRETLRRVKVELLLEGKNREYSELVEELLSEWLETRKSKNSNT